MTNSVGHIDKIVDNTAWGVFSSGPREGSTFDLPKRYTVEGDSFDIEVGAEVTFIPNSVDDDKTTYQDSYIVFAGEKALILHVTEEGSIEEGDIVKRLH